MNRRRLNGPAVLVGVALLTAACGGPAATTSTAGASEPSAASPEPSGASQEVTAVRAVLPTGGPSVLYYPFFVGQELGYFEEEGIAITVEGGAGAGAAIQQLIAGNADIAAVTPAAALNAAAEGFELNWLYTYMKIFLFGIVVPADSDIRSIEDLAGRTIGVSEPGGGEVPIVRGMLADIGLTEGADVTLLPVGEGGALTVTNFENGTIDAYSSSFVDILGVANSGLELRDITPDPIRAFPSNGIVMLTKTFEADPDLAARFLRAIAKATHFAHANPDAAATIMAKYAPEQFTDPDFGRSLLDEILRRTALPESEGGQYGQPAKRDGWDQLVTFLSAGSVEEGALAGPVDLDALIVPDLGEGVNDFDRAEVEAEAEAYPN